MLFPLRHLIALIFFILLLTTYYFYFSWSLGDSYSGRTFQGRLLGVIGLLLLLASFFSGAGRGQNLDNHLVRYPWHLLLGSLSICFILAHAGFHFGNLFAALGFLFPLSLGLSGFLIFIVDYSNIHLVQDAQASHARLLRLRRRCVSIHAILTAGLIAFVLIHILSIVYY